MLNWTSIPFPAAAIQLPTEFPRYGFQVHEVAEATSGALSVGKQHMKGLKLTVYHGVKSSAEFLRTVIF